MRYVKQKNVGRKTCRVTPLRGIDRNGRATQGSLYDCQNLTSDGLPYWKVRTARGRWKLREGSSETEVSGFFPFSTPVRGACSLEGGLCWATDKELFIGGRKVEGVTLTPSDRKQLIPIGRDLFIAPDGVFLHREYGEWRAYYAGHRFLSGERKVYCGPCTEDGSPITLSAASSTPPEQPYEGEVWLDTSGLRPAAKRYSETDGWMEFTVDKLYLTAANIGDGFRVGDNVRIFAQPFVDVVSTPLLQVSSSFIVFEGSLQYPVGVPSAETVVERHFPQMDFAVEVNNRIWGCRCGENANGEFVNEVFCCAAGDPLTWTRYGTGEADCFCASLGCTGAFTGAAALFDDILFFKEDCIVTVSGLFPANFRVSCYEARGVRVGCERSLARLGSTLVYCGADGVYKTNGSTCSRLCDGFPVTALDNAVGGVFGDKYYLAADWQDGTRKIAVFERGLQEWFCEDDRYKTQFFIPQRNALYMLNLPLQASVLGVNILWYCICVSDVKAPGKYTNCLLVDNTDESDYMYEPLPDCTWYALTNWLDNDSAALKNIRNVYVRFDLQEGAALCVELLTDRGETHQLGKFVGDGQRRRQMEVHTLPCTGVQLRLSGTGMCTVYEIGFDYEQVKGEDEYEQ